MNKGELITKLAEKTGLSKSDSEKAWKGLLDVIKETTAAGEKISIVGFGTFEKVHTEARTGRNPSTGNAIEVAANDKLKVKISAAFSKEAYAS
jgi:DNA-binding protein HU-beta